MTKSVRRGLIAVAVLAGVGYLTPVVYLMANEKRMVFQPDHFGGRAVVPLPGSLGLIASRVSLTSGDGAKFTGLVIPAVDTAAQWLLYFHGNAGNVTSSVLPQFYARWHAR